MRLVNTRGLCLFTRRAANVVYSSVSVRTSTWLIWVAPVPQVARRRKLSQESLPCVLFTQKNGRGRACIRCARTGNKSRSFQLLCAVQTMYPAAEIFVSFLFAALYYGASALNETKPVYFSLIISGGENGSFRSSGGIPSIDIALEAVQSRRILPGYNLTYDRVRNSKVLLTR